MKKIKCSNCGSLYSTTWQKCPYCKNEKTETSNLSYVDTKDELDKIGSLREESLSNSESVKTIAGTYFVLSLVLGVVFIMCSIILGVVYHSFILFLMIALSGVIFIIVGSFTSTLFKWMSYMLDNLIAINDILRKK